MGDRGEVGWLVKILGEGDAATLVEVDEEEKIFRVVEIADEEISWLVKVIETADEEENDEVIDRAVEWDVGGLAFPDNRKRISSLFIATMWRTRILIDGHDSLKKLHPTHLFLRNKCLIELRFLEFNVEHSSAARKLLCHSLPSRRVSSESCACACIVPALFFLTDSLVVYNSAWGHRRGKTCVFSATFLYFRHRQVANVFTRVHAKRRVLRWSFVRAWHKLLGNFLATFRISSNFFCFEQVFAFWAISSFLDIGAAFSALIGHASIFYNVSVDNLWISCKKGAVPAHWGRSWAKDACSRAAWSAVF